MRRKNFSLCTRVAWLVALLGVGATAVAQTFLPRGDGWYAWHIDAVPDAAYRCCFAWQHDNPKAQICDLDDRHGGYGSFDETSSSPGVATIYARVRNGKLDRVHAFSRDCRVRTRTPVVTLEAVSAEQSLALLSELAHQDDARHHTHEAVSAIALHAGRAARDALVALAQPGESLALRKAAVFHMGQLRSVETRAPLTHILFHDDEPAMREHAAFSVSESQLEDRASLLVQLGNEDPRPGVRGKAWFWLAQTAAPRTEASIFHALENDTSSKARHEAIFALAQLPDERAARALIRVVEMQNLHASDRKQALFWLAQGESDAGLDYLSDLLND